jgi:thiamine biosynthesis lipoprotein
MIIALSEKEARPVKHYGKHAVRFMLILALLLQLGACGSTGTVEKTNKTAFVLDTSCTITIYGGSRADNEKLLEGCFALCEEYENLLSTTRETSDIYKLNHRQTDSVSEETAALLQKGLDYGARTGGAFDITIEPLSSLWNFDAASPSVPPADDISKAARAVNYKNVRVSGTSVSFADEDTQIDLGGIAKGYIADRIAAYLRQAGCAHALINLGGNVLCVGGKPDGTPFTVGIEKPFEGSSIASVQIRDLSVVTSGVYERCFYENGRLYHHILDPKTGYPFDNGLLSVTVIGPSSCDCDALSTSCFALSLDAGLDLVAANQGYYAIFVTNDYQLHFSDGAETLVNVSD